MIMVTVKISGQAVGGHGREFSKEDYTQAIMWAAAKTASLIARGIVVIGVTVKEL